MRRNLGDPSTGPVEGKHQQSTYIWMNKRKEVLFPPTPDLAHYVLYGRDFRRCENALIPQTSFLHQISVAGTLRAGRIGLS